MRVVIVGAGAMGSLFGVMLSAEADVCLLDFYQAHIEAINQKGLMVDEMNGTQRVYHLFATTVPEKIETQVDLAIIFTKSNQTKQAAQIAKPLLGSKGVALTLQNGLGNLETIAGIIGRDRAIAGVVSHGANMIAPGHIRHAGKGPVYIEKSDRHIGLLTELTEIFTKAGIETHLSENLDSLIWGKLVVNIGINALTAILRVPNGVLADTIECEKIMTEAVTEAVLVAKAHHIELPYDNPLERVKEACRKTGKNRSSMLQDIFNGRPTEIGAINRAVANKGMEVNIDTPYNIFLSEIIEAMEATAERRIQ